MRIAVVGAGIGGLACTILLRRQNHSVSIFDQFTEPAPVGSGLMLQPVGLTVLDHLRLGDVACLTHATAHNPGSEYTGPLCSTCYSRRR